MQPVRSLEADREARLGCGCDAEKIQALHLYLGRYFTGYVLEDFHAPTRLLPMAVDSEHHVVSITHPNVLPYYAVLLNECQEQRVAEFEELLRQSDLAGALRANRIAVVSKSGASSL